MSGHTLTSDGCDRHAGRKAVNLSLNADLVARAKKLTRDLSGTVEDLLAGFVKQEQARGAGVPLILMP